MNERAKGVARKAFFVFKDKTKRFFVFNVECSFSGRLLERSSGSFLVSSRFFQAKKTNKTTVFDGNLFVSFSTLGAAVWAAFFCWALAFLACLAALKRRVTMNLSFDRLETLRNRFLSLSLSKFWFLVSFGENVIPSDTGDGTFELNCSASSFLDFLFSCALFVFSSIQNCPCNASRISSQIGRTLTFRIQINVNLEQIEIFFVEFNKRVFIFSFTLPSTLTTRFPWPG